MSFKNQITWIQKLRKDLEFIQSTTGILKFCKNIIPGYIYNIIIFCNKPFVSYTVDIVVFGNFLRMDTGIGMLNIV